MSSKPKNVLKPKPEPESVSSLLGTNNPIEQVQLVKMLTQPTWTLAITFDGRMGKTVGLSFIGPNIPMEVAHRMLDDARQILVKMQAQKAAPIPESSTPPKE